MIIVVRAEFLSFVSVTEDLTRANFRFLDNLPISQFILNFVRPHKTKNITDTIVYDSYVRKKQRAGFMGWRGEGRGNRCIV